MSSQMAEIVLKLSRGKAVRSSFPDCDPEPHSNQFQRAQNAWIRGLAGLICFNSMPAPNGYLRADHGSAGAY
jgi:hypothetical protein